MHAYALPKVPHRVTTPCDHTSDGHVWQVLQYHPPGEVICKQGDEGKAFYVIVGGSVKVESKGSHLIAI